MGNLLNIAQKRRLAILNEVPAIMHLSYATTTELNLRIETQSGDDWEIDWGDGVWEQYASSPIDQTKTFANPTAGVARVRSATGRGIVDLHRFQSTTGTWNFDISALSNATYRVLFSGNMMELTGDISALSNVTHQVRLTGSSMKLTYSSTAWNTVPENDIYFNIETGRLSTAEIDQLLSDLNAVGSNGTATIDLRYNNGAPSPSGVTAANELMARGYTVLTN